VSGEQERELVGRVDGTPVQAQAADQLEHQVERVLADAHPLGGVGAEADASEDRLDRVAGPQVQPVLLGEVVEGGQLLPVPLQAVRGGALAAGAQLVA
jgi:hypothetical protein